jgi:CHASE2 domain-containing sensor protein
LRIMKLLNRLSPKGFSREEKVRFCINLGIGLAIAIVLQFFEHTDLGETAINKAFDYVIAREAAESARSAASTTSIPATKIARQILFIDLGKVYQQRENPILTPRDELARIIGIACRKKAKVIVLDILLEGEDCCHPEHDRQLRNVLQEMIAQKIPTRILFPVRIGSDGRMKRSFFDELLANTPHFYPVIPFISATASDRVVRYWVPFERVKGHPKYPLLWNASLLAALASEEKEKDLQIIQQEIRDQKGSRPYFIRLGNQREIEISSEREDLYRNRIRFLLIPPNLLKKYPGGNLFERVSDIDEVEFTDFNDKIVIIGNANPEAGDIHLTPVGHMPGMYIIGNALNTILLGLQPSHPSVILNMVIELVVIIVSAYVLSRFPPLLIRIAKGVLLIAVLSAISYYYFLRTGVLLNFTFAVMAMGLHDTALTIERALVQRKKTGKEGKR